jgi:hypothetical protein
MTEEKRVDSTYLSDMTVHHVKAPDYTTHNVGGFLVSLMPTQRHLSLLFYNDSVDFVTETFKTEESGNKMYIGDPVARYIREDKVTMVLSVKQAENLIDLLSSMIGGVTKDNETA